MVGGAEAPAGNCHVEVARGTRGPGSCGGGSANEGVLVPLSLRDPPSFHRPQQALPNCHLRAGGRRASPCALIGGICTRRGGAAGFAQRYWLRRPVPTS